MHVPLSSTPTTGCNTRLWRLKKFDYTFFSVQSKQADLEHRLLQQKTVGYLQGRLVAVWFSLINESYGWIASKVGTD